MYIMDCLIITECPLSLIKSIINCLRRIWMKFSVKVVHITGKKRLDFGGKPPNECG